MSATWANLLAQRGASSKPWLIVPKAPRESAEHRAVSFAELSAQATRAAFALRYLAHGDSRRAIVIADNSAECAICVLAVLSSGLTLVPAAPPTLGPASTAWRNSLQALAAAASPTLVIGNACDIHNLNLGPGSIPVSFEQLLLHTGSQRADRASYTDEAALWQSTSGTTSRAKTVMLSHDNILSNIDAIGRRIEVSRRDIGASWLPLFHDMGLIGALLFSTYWGMPLVLMKPRSFVAHPEAWLWAIDRFKVTCSPAPSSAYEICASKVRETKTQGLDLSSWRVAFNGAEHVHPATVERFCARYAAHGFRAEAMYPVYGLAEHTVAATLPELGEGLQLDWVDAATIARGARVLAYAPETHGARALASVGQPLPGHALRITDETGELLTDRQLGEIELRGPSRMLGYRGDHGSQATVANGWLKTGDLGYLSQGRLFVVGREKHIVKRAGSNIDAAAIEACVREIPLVRARPVAAFGVFDAQNGTEQLVVQVEVGRLPVDEQRELRSEIVRAIRAQAGVVPDLVELTAPGSIPRTTSGKIQHGAAREKFQGGRSCGSEV
jgi:acyl-CoA synthetase (AMP-forming)/AMP-acid ligase II